MKEITIQITSEELDMLETFLTCKLDENREEQYRRACISIWGRMVRQYDADVSIEREPHRCSNCNAINVQAKAWVGLNDNTYIDFSLSESGEYEDHWCSDCQSHYFPDKNDDDFFNFFMETK